MTLATTDLTAEQAREVTEQIRVSAEGLLDLVVQAFRGRVWLALGYESWDAWKVGEIGDLELPRDVIPALRSEGMSQRAIATVTGVDHKTVHNDLKATGEDSPVPDRVTGLDGKSRPATRTFDCPICHKTFDHRVRHCETCGKHWKPGEDCTNCVDRLIEAFPAAVQLPANTVPEALAGLAALDGMEDEERQRRSEIFGRWIDSQIERPDPSPSEIFAREASALIDRAARLGTEVAVVVRQLDMKGIDVWATEYDWPGIAEGLRTAAAFLDSQPRIRRVQ